MAPRRILVFADCGPSIGGGHVMRCLTLARALALRGAEVAFAANPFGRGVLEAFGAREMTVFPVSDDPAEAAGAAATWADGWGADWVLLDHYVLTADQEAALKGGRRLAVIADRADRPRLADLLLDSAHGRTAADYAALTPPGAAILAGPAFAPVRPEFAAHRDAALKRRREGGHLGRLLVSLGLTDVDGITGRVVGVLRPLFPDLVFDVALGGSAPSLPALRDRAKADRGLRLHVDSHAMAGQMAEADIAVGAGGSSTWERAVLGLPTVSVCLADNQRPMAQAMAADGLILTADAGDAGFEAALADAVRRLVGEPALRRAVSEATAAICDGRGAERFATALLG